MEIAMWEDELYPVLMVSRTIDKGDVAIDIPDVLLNRYEKATKEFYAAQEALRGFMKEQDKTDRYMFTNTDDIRVLRYRD